MRIRLSLHPLSFLAYFPLNHYSLAAFIYRTIGYADPEFSQFLHDEGLRPGTPKESAKKFKLFSFSLPKLPSYTFEPSRLRFEEGFVQWQISSPLSGFVEALVAGLSAQGTVQIEGQAYQVRNIEIILPPRFTSSMRMMALSPITVSVSTPREDGKQNKHYVRANDERYAPLVISNLLEKYKALTGKSCDPSELQFAFDWDYIERRGGMERVSKLILYKDTRIKGYLAPFFLSGEPKLLSLAWECGLGSSNSQGFGMIGV